MGVRVIMPSLVAGKTSKGRQVTKIVEVARIRIENAIKRVRGEDS